MRAKRIGTPNRPALAGSRALPILAAAVLASLLAGCGSPPGPSLPSTETRAAVVEVRGFPAPGEDEERGIELLVRLPDFAATGIRAARVIVRSAADDLGTDLVPRKPPPGRPLARSVAPGGGILVPLDAPSPAATRLPEVLVEVQLDATGNDPSTLASFPRFLADAGTPLESRALADANVGVEILTPDEVEAVRAAAEEKKRAEGEEKGLGGGLLEASVLLGFGKPLVPGPGDVFLRVRDPNSRIREFVLLDAGGVARETLRADRGGLTVLACEAGSPGPDWTLQVHLQSPKTLRRYSFTLKDVALR